MSFDPSEIPLGLYKIYWLSGGYSLAAVGFNNAGKRWLAPTNWIFEENGPSFDWNGVKSVELLYKR